ncbi:hypothetical protein [Silvibacterium dinghuense]|uniref:Uncharacterized protein n=1 Tax=Silvibacterium dinghuense TaxID=1560006 RepID=A0A4Q1SKM9_9BACT|nr:hypothetical protein [Silvibacterium dinghuense]RXS97860.1 hypothetical protein ESZ00_08375 [Silvibacterium dinghuense]
MDQYRRGHERQRTSARVHKQIKAAIAEGFEVEVLAATPESTVWNGLPVNTAAGLEIALIQTMKPTWNIRMGYSISQA